MTEARQKAEERLAKAWKDQCIANELNIFEDDVVIAHIEWLRAALVAREQELEKYRSSLRELTSLVATVQNVYDIKAARWMMEQPAYKNAVKCALPGASQEAGGLNSDDFC